MRNLSIALATVAASAAAFVGLAMPAAAAQPDSADDFPADLCTWLVGGLGCEQHRPVVAATLPFDPATDLPTDLCQWLVCTSGCRPTTPQSTSTLG